jgi:hypothetical protein
LCFHDAPDDRRWRVSRQGWSFPIRDQHFFSGATSLTFVPPPSRWPI